MGVFETQQWLKHWRWQGTVLHGMQAHNQTCLYVTSPTTAARLGCNICGSAVPVSQRKDTLWSSRREEASTHGRLHTTSKRLRKMDIVHRLCSIVENVAWNHSWGRQATSALDSWILPSVKSGNYHHIMKTRRLWSPLGRIAQGSLHVMVLAPRGAMRGSL
jgi:hypothetical protein